MRAAVKLCVAAIADCAPARRTTGDRMIAHRKQIEGLMLRRSLGSYSSLIMPLPWRYFVFGSYGLLSMRHPTGKIEGRDG
jgi:hypothetical protein